MELGRDISKLVEWVSCKLVFPHRNTKKKKNQAETVRTNFVRTPENSQRLAATK